MRRKYLDRVYVYRHTPTADGYGGNTLTETLLASSWAGVESLSAFKLTQFGLDTSKQSIRVRMRYRSDVDYKSEGVFLKYKTKEWIPTSIENVGLENEEIIIIATER